MSEIPSWFIQASELRLAHPLIVRQNDGEFTGKITLMIFTALHRALGLPPGPLTDAMLDEAVAADVSETDDLHWKWELPPVSNLSQTDVPKDIAAMADSGGGMIVYGVEEEQKAATERRHRPLLD